MRSICVLVVLGEPLHEAHPCASSAVAALAHEAGRLRPEHSALALHTVIEKAFSASPREALGLAGVIHLGP
ncbi:hypothetical protein ABZ759_24915 [Streptomyces sp. NPDC047860]|uniref:hypothetical protein n=1 Tax=Streptomyces sp. NPDC047860 TaxID=3155743 RepID=UPI0033CFE01D